MEAVFFLWSPWYLSFDCCWLVATSLLPGSYVIVDMYTPPPLLRRKHKQNFERVQRRTAPRTRFLHRKMCLLALIFVPFLSSLRCPRSDLLLTCGCGSDGWLFYSQPHYDPSVYFGIKLVMPVLFHFCFRNVQNKCRVSKHGDKKW